MLAAFRTDAHRTDEVKAQKFSEVVWRQHNMYMLPIPGYAYCREWQSQRNEIVDNPDVYVDFGLL
jgi:hypothetical protein